MENNKTMQVDIQLADNYENEYAKFNSATIKLEMPLTQGIHTIQSSYIEIGRLKVSRLNKKERPIQMSVEVWYRYDPEHNLITLCDSDFVSDDATKLRTRLADAFKTNVQFAFEDTKSPCEGNDEWDYTSPLTPNLKKLFQQNVRDINSAIFEEAKMHKMTILTRSPFPDMPKELYENLFLVYEEGIYAGLYDPTKQYADNVQIKPLKSVYGGTINYIQGNYANVIGSTGDPLPYGYGSWIQLWNYIFRMNANRCSAYNFQGFNCDNTIYGGHVLFGKIASQIPYGSNRIVFIIPICSNHNKNNKAYMAPLVYDFGVWLDNYHL